MDGPVTGCFGIVMLITGWHRQRREPFVPHGYERISNPLRIPHQAVLCKTLKTTRWHMLEL